MAPVLSFTADEIWQHMQHEDQSHSVHMDLFIPLKDQYRDPGLLDRWENIINVRREVTKALEIARKEKRVGHSLDASLTLGLPDRLMESLRPYMNQLRSIFIVSSVQVVPVEEMDGGYESEEIEGLKVQVMPSEDTKCERCWVHDPSVGENDRHPSLCHRCHEAMAEAGYISE
jgi:isoleucyl-tRNA synthetase